MTSISSQSVPPLGIFLNSVCPGINALDQNIHFKIPTDEDDSSSVIDWPFDTTTFQRAKLNDTYLNISRPYLGPRESTTYLSLPYHVLKSFKDLIKASNKNVNAEGQLQIAANVNPLINDPFKLVNLNPGCLSVIVELDNLHERPHGADNSSTNNNLLINKISNSLKNPFNKLSTNFNKLLKISTSSSTTSYHQNLLTLDKSGFIESILDYDLELYKTQLRDCKKLLISAHINVLNVMGIDANDNFVNTVVETSTKPIIYVDEELLQQQQQQQQQLTQQTQQLSQGQVTTPQTPLKQQKLPTNAANSLPTKPTAPEYKRSVESPVLRVQFRRPAIITVLKGFTNIAHQPVVVVGFESGEITILNLADLSYHTMDYVSSNDSSFSVTSIEVILASVSHADMLIVAGYSNGEVIIVDPMQKDQDKYVKKVVGEDESITFFKKFDLSPFHTESHNLQNQSAVNQQVTSSASSSHSSATIITSNSQSNRNSSLVGHFKVSHKPITSITSTVPYGAGGLYSSSEGLSSTSLSNSGSSYLPNPMVLAIGSDDGLVKIIDLMSTYDCNYGSKLPTNNSIVTDIISNYFNDGITCINFSPDFKFLVVTGKGDIIEVFKMTYYNVNGLLNSNSKHHSSVNTPAAATTTSIGRRSRSNTLNSLNSNPPAPIVPSPNATIDRSPSVTTNLVFLPPLAATPSVSFEMNNIDGELLADSRLGSQTQLSNNSNPQSQAQPSSNSTSLPHCPPVVKDISIVARFKGHANSIQKVEFLPNSSRSNSSLVYKLILCGFDGKIIVWDFDYRALPKVKEYHHHHSHHSQHHLQPSSLVMATNNASTNSALPSKKRTSLVNRASLSTSPNPLSRAKSLTNTSSMSPIQQTPLYLQLVQGVLSKHQRTFSWSIFDDHTNNGNSTASDKEKDDIKVIESIKIINSVYKNLFDLRLKKHYVKLGKSTSAKYTSVIHPIVNDKLVPSIEIALLELDLSHWIGDGKIDGFHLDKESLWCFAKCGDIFKYSIT